MVYGFVDFVARNIENLDIVNLVARGITGTSAPSIENHDFAFFVVRGTA